MNNRIKDCFNKLSKKNKKALITFLTAGDPNFNLSLELIKKLPSAGADIIEIGMPFSDPMADGSAIQASALRSIRAGHTMQNTFEIISGFREEDNITPIILMGYFNPIYNYGTEKFINKILSLGVDGIIIVDLPPEEDVEFCDMAIEKGLSFIRLATPTTDSVRLSKIMQKTDGFLYYVSITGVTGSMKPDIVKVKEAISDIKEQIQIPVCVGFGIKTKEDVENISSFADGVIVGSALVNIIENNKSEASIRDGILQKIKDLASVL